MTNLMTVKKKEHGINIDMVKSVWLYNLAESNCCYTGNNFVCVTAFLVLSLIV